MVQAALKFEQITEIRLKGGTIKGDSIDGLAILCGKGREFIYLLESKHGCKIGKTNQPARRLSEIYTLLPFYIERITLVEVDNGYEVESILHAEYENKRIKGEWFDLCDMDKQTVRNWHEVMLISWNQEIPF